MNKICTTIEQSQKLVELGIDTKTADMYYKYVLVKSDRICHVPEIGNPIESLEWYNKGYTTFGKEPITLDEYCIPAWSLSALLSLIKPCDGETYTMRGTLDGGATIEFRRITNVMCQEDNPLDAAFEMVCWLLENNKI